MTVTTVGHLGGREQVSGSMMLNEKLGQEGSMRSLTVLVPVEKSTSQMLSSACLYECVQSSASRNLLSLASSNCPVKGHIAKCIACKEQIKRDLGLIKLDITVSQLLSFYLTVLRNQHCTLAFPLAVHIPQKRETTILLPAGCLAGLLSSLWLTVSRTFIVNKMVMDISDGCCSLCTGQGRRAGILSVVRPGRHGACQHTPSEQVSTPQRALYTLFWKICGFKHPPRATNEASD